ncbi:hypothetical protein SD80_029695 [Scytonema tolypothrichoides VB-61278]|nr:hypothetical protein SD80_029695 [Scytonema tolypothrichoides VB-61278]
MNNIPKTIQQQLNQTSLLQADWFTIFPVVVSGKEGVENEKMPPMYGNYTVNQKGVVFYPRYPLQEGQCYTAIFRLGRLQTLLSNQIQMITDEQVTAVITNEFCIPKLDIPPAQIVRVYPSSDHLPENLLRFYLYFSSEMRRGSALQHIHLFDSHEQEIDSVFLDTGEELWDSTATRLTLLFDPGRVKKGLKAHVNMGRALTVGETYRLVIDRNWLDAQGRPLQSSFLKQFTVVFEDIIPPAIENWTVIAPKADTQEPLLISFPKPLDHVSLVTLNHVEDDDSNRVKGTVDLLNDEKIWTFTPTRPWMPGLYTLFVDPRLEDIAGNNLNGLFDKPIGKQTHSHHQAKLSLKFQAQ